MTRTVTTRVHFKPGGRCGKRMVEGAAPVPPPSPPGRVPRLARLLALAHRFERLIEDGAVVDQAQLAELGHVTRARVTQIMNLLQLAPEIQDEILHMPRVAHGRDPISERDVRPIAGELRWDRQRVMWQRLVAKTGVVPSSTQHDGSTP